MDFIVQLDGGLNNATRLFFLIIGLWGLLRAVRGAGVDGSYYGAMAIGELLFVIEFVFDMILLVGGLRPERWEIHYLYAVFAMLLIPFVYANVLRGDDSNRAMWVYTFVTVFLFGIAARAITTGG